MGPNNWRLNESTIFSLCDNLTMRLTTAICFLTLFSSTAFSQNDSTSNHIRFGFNGGGGLSIPTPNTIYDKSDNLSSTSLTRWSFQGALMVMIPMADNVWIKTGFGGAQRAFAYRVDGFTFGSDFDPETGQFAETSLEAQGSVTEITIPLLVQADFWKKRLFFDAGMLFSYRIKGSYERNFTSGAEASVYRPPIDISRDFAPYITLGIGYQLTTVDGMNLVLAPFIDYGMTSLSLIDASPELSCFGLKTSLCFGKP